jgi:hypothetical protein
MRLSASEPSIGFRSHLVGAGVDLALTAGEWCFSLLLMRDHRPESRDCRHDLRPSNQLRLLSLITPKVRMHIKEISENGR